MAANAVIEKKELLSKDLWIAGGICLFTFICFSHIMQNQFLYWDDNAFVSGNPYIRGFTWANIKYLFSHEFGANWQPITMLSYSLNYYFSKLSPGGYFITNLLIHIANTALVFVFIKKLFTRFWKTANAKGAATVAAITSLWFGIHPMHVESVGWLFERKDVLYTFFYLWGLITYINYLNTKKLKALVYTFLLFGFSCMSKPMAVVFPFSLLLIDFLLNGKIEKKQFMQKTPFLLLSLIIGFLTLHTQSEEHAFALSFSLSNRFFIASYSFLAYIGKLFVPINLSAFYPYPVNPGQSLPGLFYLCPLIILLVVGLPLYLTRKKNKAWFNILVFGFGFYLVNIALVLQFFSVGSAIISDRYSYISYIGLFSIIAYAANALLNHPDGKLATQATLGLFTFIFAILGYQRTLIWQDTGSMLGNVNAQYPGKVPQAYKYLGIYYARRGRTQDAFNCYDTLINKMHIRDAGAYCNMGSVYMSMHNDDEALKYLQASLQLDSKSFMSYEDIGLIYANKGDYTTALQYYDNARQIYPNDEGLYFNIGYAHMALKQYDKAIGVYNFLIRLSPDNALYWFNRGVAEYTANDKPDAKNDFEKTLTLPEFEANKPYNLKARACNNLSELYKEEGDSNKATYYLQQAKQMGYNPGK